MSFPVLQKGDQGIMVRELQKLLNTAMQIDPPLILTARFDDATDFAVREFQKVKKLKDDGIMGSGTWPLLTKDADAAKTKPGKVTKPEVNIPLGFTAMQLLSKTFQDVLQSLALTGLPSTEGKTEAEKYDVYESYILAFGQSAARTALTDKKKVLLGLRVPTSTGSNKGKGTYDDRMVVLWQAADGTKHAQEFKFNTEPSSQYQGKEGADVGGDKQRDLGCLPPGSYGYKKSTSTKLGSVLRPRQTLYVERDTNRDGVFDSNDTYDPKKLGGLSSGDSVLIHKGGLDNTWSAACQTIPKDEFGSFWKALDKQNEFEYVLVKVA